MSVIISHAVYVGWQTICFSSFKGHSRILLIHFTCKFYVCRDLFQSVNNESVSSVNTDVYILSYRECPNYHECLCHYRWKRSLVQAQLVLSLLLRRLYMKGKHITYLQWLMVLQLLWSSIKNWQTSRYEYQLCVCVCVCVCFILQVNSN